MSIYKVLYLTILVFFSSGLFALNAELEFTKIEPFNLENTSLNEDSIYSGKSEVKINKKREFTFKGYILPTHIEEVIKSEMSELEKGKYMVEYEIEEKNNLIVRKKVLADVYANKKKKVPTWVALLIFSTLMSIVTSAGGS